MNSFGLCYWPRFLIFVGACSYRWLEHRPLNSIVAGICMSTACAIFERRIVKARQQEQP